MIVMSEPTYLRTHQKPRVGGVDPYIYQGSHLPRENTSYIRSQSEPGPYGTSTPYSASMGSGDEEVSDWTTEPSRSPPSYEAQGPSTNFYSTQLALRYAPNDREGLGSMPDGRSSFQRQHTRRQRKPTPKGSKPFARKSKTGHSHFVTPAGASQGFRCTFVENGQPCGEKTFGLPSQIRDHLIQIHMRFSPFQCQHCKRVFTRLSLLTRHLVKNPDSEERTCPNDPVSEEDSHFVYRTQVKDALWEIQLRQEQVDKAVKLVERYNGILDEKRKRAYANTSGTSSPFSPPNTLGKLPDRGPTATPSTTYELSSSVAHAYYGSPPFEIPEHNRPIQHQQPQQPLYPMNHQSSPFTLPAISSDLNLRREDIPLPSSYHPDTQRLPPADYTQQNRRREHCLDERSVSEAGPPWSENIQSRNLWPQLPLVNVEGSGLNGGLEEQRQKE